MHAQNSIEPFVEPLSTARSRPGWTWAAAGVLAFALVGLWADLARLDRLAGLPGPFDAGIQWWAYTLTLVAGLMLGRAWSRSRSRPARHTADAELSRLPVFLGFEGRRAVVVGGGRVAASKIPALLAAGADVTVIAPAIFPLIDRSRVRIIERAFMPEDLDGAWFVTAAAHSAVNRAVHDAAEARHIFVNAVDDPRHATAYLGGTIARGGVTIAVSTSGEAPALAGLLREAIDDMLPSELGTWLQRARELSRRQRASGVPMERRRPQLLETLNRIYDKPKGLSPQSEGLSPRPKGLSPRSEGLSPQSEGLSPRSEGLSPRSEDLSTPTAQNVAPTIQNVATNLPPSREALRRTAGALAEAGQVCRSAEELESAQ